MRVPLQYLSGSGVKAAPVVALTWGVLIVSVTVIVIISALLVAAIWRKRPAGDARAVLPDGGGLSWLWIGAGVSALALLVTVVWTVIVLANIEGPPTAPGVAIEITGKQWWWQGRYLDGAAGHAFTTANEFHIPVGEPVRLKLIGGDVIHSFWVPQLAGKMDAIPGQTNETWIEAAKPGVYIGQCTEYCGVQHSKMLFRVIADTPKTFRAWWAHQLATAPDLPAFNDHCGTCHAVRGTQARGSFGPDLSHLKERQTLASAVLPNDDVTLAHWVENPQGPKPGSLMPAVKLTPDEHDQILSYLKALQ